MGFGEHVSSLDYDSLYYQPMINIIDIVLKYRELEDYDSERVILAMYGDNAYNKMVKKILLYKLTPEETTEIKSRGSVHKEVILPSGRSISGTISMIDFTY